MKVKVLGSGAGYGPDGVMTSWAANSVVDVADDDEGAVQFYRRWVDSGSAVLVEDIAKPPEPELSAKTPATKAAHKSSSAKSDDK